jgi:hypothetical protein
VAQQVFRGILARTFLHFSSSLRPPAAGVQITVHMVERLISLGVTCSSSTQRFGRFTGRDRPALSRERIPRSAVQHDPAPSFQDKNSNNNNRDNTNGIRNIHPRAGDSSLEEHFIVQEVELGDGPGGSALSTSSWSSFDIAEGTRNNQLLRAVKRLFIPQRAVTDDYLDYQLWTFPSHVFGWMSHSLAGSSMLSALGIGSGPAAAVGLSASIKWVTKDGIGAAGRLFVGGKLGTSIDEDPKRWRMIAEAFTTAGLFLEIATQLSPTNFVVLAGAGTVAKAVGHGIGRPCFRVIQNHFAKANNVGDVSAKEEVWETTAQLVGIAASVALLSTLDALDAQEAVVPAWVAVQALHVGLRYYSLRMLRFPWPNLKRGNMLASAYITSDCAGDAVVPTLARLSFEENVFRGANQLLHGTSCLFGTSWMDAVGKRPAEETTEIIRLYRNEKYVLIVKPSREIHVVLWVDTDGADLMKAMLQASWIDQHANYGTIVSPMELQSESLRYATARFEEFSSLAAEAGWDFDRTIFPLDSRDVRLERLEVV